MFYALYLKRADTAQNSVELKNIYFENFFIILKFNQIVYCATKKFYEITNEGNRAYFSHIFHYLEIYLD